MFVTRALIEWGLKHRGKWPEFGERTLPHWKGGKEERASLAQIHAHILKLPTETARPPRWPLCQTPPILVSQAPSLSS